MKKFLSCVLSASMILANATAIATVQAAELTEPGYTMVDLPYNAKGYLSKDNEGKGTVTQGSISDWFMGTDSKNQTSTALAINKDNIDKQHVNGILKGAQEVPFKISTAEDEKNVLAYQNSGGTISFTPGYYSKARFAYIFPIQGYDFNDWTSYEFKSGSNKSSNYTMTTGYVADVEWLKVNENSVLPTKNDDSKIYYMDLTVPAELKGKKIEEIGIWTEYKISRRYLGLTMVELYGDEWKPVIEEKLITMPTVSEYTDSNYAAFVEADEIITKAEKQGVDISKIDGIEKYTALKKLVAAKQRAFNTIDLSKNGADSKIFLSNDKKGSYTVDTANAYDFFIEKSGGNDLTKAYAVSKESMDELLTDGILNHNGTPYYISTDSDKNAVGKSNFNVPAGYYKQFKVLTIRPTLLWVNDNQTAGTHDFIYMMAHNGSDKLFDMTLFNGSNPTNIATVKLADVYENENVSGTLTIQEHTVTVPKAYMGNKINKFGLYCSGLNTTRIIAVTGVRVIGDDLKTIIEEKIKVLPDAANITTENRSAVGEVEELVKEATLTGADVSDISNIQKYNEIEAKLNQLCKDYVPLDITGNLNTKSMLSEKEAGTVKTAAKPNYFVNDSDVTLENSFGLNKDKIEAMTENGILNYAGIQYKLPSVSSNGNDSFIGTNWKPNGHYEELKVLVASNVDEPYYYEVKYTDGTTDGTSSFQVKKYNNSDTTNRVMTAGTVNASKTGTNNGVGNVYEGTIKIKNPEKNISEIAWYSPNGTTRILAVSGKQYFGTGVSEITATAENDNIEFNVTFAQTVEQADIIKDNIKVVAGADTVDYTVTYVDDKNAKISLKNTLSSQTKYTVSVKIGDSCDYEKDFTIEKPIIVENYYSTINGTTATATGKVTNNTYTGSKAVKVITVVYENDKLYKTEISDKTVAKGTSEEFTNNITVEEGNEYTVQTFVWDSDMITPLTLKK